MEEEKGGQDKEEEAHENEDREDDEGKRAEEEDITDKLKRNARKRPKTRMRTDKLQQKSDGETPRRLDLSLAVDLDLPNAQRERADRAHLALTPLGNHGVVTEGPRFHSRDGDTADVGDRVRSEPAPPQRVVGRAAGHAGRRDDRGEGKSKKALAGRDATAPRRVETILTAADARFQVLGRLAGVHLSGRARPHPGLPAVDGLCAEETAAIGHRPGEGL